MWLRPSTVFLFELEAETETEKSQKSPGSSALVCWYWS